MPKSLQITPRMRNLQPQHQTTRLMSRFRVATLENTATRQTHPTGAVAPTCRRDYGLVNAIPAGYESDDSWDNLSHNHDRAHSHNIVPLLTLRPWCNSSRRGPEQQQFRQQSATNVRSGNAPVLQALGQSTMQKAH